MSDSLILLEKKFLDELKNIFKSTVPDAQIWAYGSRVDGSAHSGSDLDLAMLGEGNISALEQALQDSNIPFLVDVVKFENLPESFQQEILKKYYVLQ